MLNLSINVFAISRVGDLEATAISTPLSFNAYKMPLAWGYKDGISRLERHSLKKFRKSEDPTLIQHDQSFFFFFVLVPFYHVTFNMLNLHVATYPKALGLKTLAIRSSFFLKNWEMTDQKEKKTRKYMDINLIKPCNSRYMSM